MIDPKYNLSIFFAMHVRAWLSMIGYGHIALRDLTYESLGLKIERNVLCALLKKFLNP